MKNRFTLLLAFLAAFAITSPAFAESPEPATAEAKADEKVDEKADDAKADDAKADDAKADDAKADDAKADDAKAEGGEVATDDAKADDAKAEGGEVATDEEAAEAAKDLIVAIHQKHWALALGLGLSLLVFGLRKVKVLAKVPSKMLPWVTAALGIVGYIVVALTTEGADIMDAVWGGAVTGIAAVGLWEMVLKNFLGSKKSDGGSGG